MKSVGKIVGAVGVEFIPGIEVVRAVRERRGVAGIMKAVAFEGAFVAATVFTGGAGGVALKAGKVALKAKKIAKVAKSGRKLSKGRGTKKLTGSLRRGGRKRTIGPPKEKLGGVMPGPRFGKLLKKVKRGKKGVKKSRGARAQRGGKGVKKARGRGGSIAEMAGGGGAAGGGYDMPMGTSGGYASSSADGSFKQPRGRVSKRYVITDTATGETKPYVSKSGTRRRRTRRRSGGGGVSQAALIKALIAKG